MFDDLASYPWVMETQRYGSEAQLRDLLPSALDAANAHVRALATRTT
jgi:hypothetical protein